MRTDPQPPLWPTPAQTSACPRDGAELADPVLHFPGWRALVEGTCTSCGRRMLRDLPTGHGLVYATGLDLDTGEVFDRSGASWFSGSLKALWEWPDEGAVGIRVARTSSRPVGRLAMCLDAVYGHALLKTLALQPFARSAPGDTAVVAVVPASLELLVPASVGELWLVDEPFARLGGWLTAIDQRVHERIRRFDRCDLASLPPHPHPSTWTLNELRASVGAERHGEPSIVVSLRDDRTWGTDPEDQAQRLARWWQLLRSAFPRVEGTIIGVGAPASAPDGLIDLRRGEPTLDDERRWAALAAGADLAFGVHGSNLLLPSGLAGATLELLPRGRHDNAFQASLVTEADPLLALHRHRTLYGDTELSDVTPELAFEVAAAIIDGSERVRRLLIGPAAGMGQGPPAPLEPAPQREPPPCQPRLEARVREQAARTATAVRSAGGNAVAAVRRQWLQRRLPVLVRDSRGFTFELETVEEVLVFERHGGHFEDAERELVAQYLQPDDVAFDVGANIGAFTTVMARGAGEVHAFEPSDEAARRLKRTLALNSIGNVAITQAAVADTSGEAPLSHYGHGYGSWSTLAPRKIPIAGDVLQPVATVSVPLVALDGYCVQRGLERISVLKIDVEGAEGRVLAGASGLLADRAVDLVLLEVAETTLGAAGTSPTAVLESLYRCGYRTYRVADPSGAVRPFRIAGRLHDRMINVVAASPDGVTRLRSRGLLAAG